MSSKSIIELSPASAAFVRSRRTSLGPWVLGGFMDCIFLGVLLCQVYRFLRFRRTGTGLQQKYYFWLVIAVTFLSVLKTSQAIAIVWVQNVLDFANPDVARLLVSEAWYQVSVPLMTGIIGAIVQLFFCFRFYKLSGYWPVAIVICCAIALGIAGVCLSLANIVSGNVKAKVMWLLVHLVSVFIADFLITIGTVYTLRRRNTGMANTVSLINRLLRLVFESAMPPAIIAMIDLILTQTLKSRLLWHLFVNYALAKLYPISLMYTLNSINEYRVKDSTSQEAYSLGQSRRGDIELGSRGAKDNQILIQTHVSTHVSPSNPIEIHDFTRSVDAMQTKSTKSEDYIVDADEQKTHY